MLITFEGPDGSGKTTQLALLVDFLAGLGYSVVRVREPGGTAIGEQIREVLHHTGNQEMQPLAEVLLYSAARATGRCGHPPCAGRGSTGRVRPVL
jgi:dTMP kinase